MPRIRSDQPQFDPTPQPTIVERLRSGKAVPIIGSALTQDLLFGGHDAVVKAYGEYNHHKCKLKQRLCHSERLYAKNLWCGTTDSSAKNSLRMTLWVLKFTLMVQPLSAQRPHIGAGDSV